MKTLSKRVTIGNFLLLILLLLLACASQSLAQIPFLVKDVQPGPDASFPSQLTNVNSMLFFRADDGTTGRELWKSDGTSAGTARVKDVNPGPADGLPFLVNMLEDVNGTLFFGADDGTTGLELWKSDGTTVGTVLIKDINPGPLDGLILSLGIGTGLTAVNGTLFFTADDGNTGSELWKSDGTAAGTVMVKDINPGLSGSGPSWLTDVNGTLFFTADDGSTGTELWMSDGTTAGTVMVKDLLIGPFSSSPFHLTNINGTVFFVAFDANGDELWKSDGTAAGTILVKDINPGGNGLLRGTPWLTNVNNTLFFAGKDGNTGNELWKSDGTTAGTVMVKEIYPGSFGSNPAWLANFNGTLFFSASNEIQGGELWKSDGTTAGTVLVKDINNGTANSYPTSLANINGMLYFGAREATTGTELWKSDGTADGTVLAKDINPGPFSSSPGGLLNVGGTLYFSADDGTRGFELWRLGQPVTITLTPSNPPIVIPPGGGLLQFDVTVNNISGLGQSTQYWNTVTLPGGEEIGPVGGLGPFNITVASGESFNTTHILELPSRVPPATYGFNMKVGTFPNTVLDVDSFTFSKSAGSSAKVGAGPETGDDWAAAWQTDAKLSITVEGAIPEGFVLEQNYPNPFNPSTTIKYQLPKAEKVRISIYDLTGRQVRELVNEHKEAGSYFAQWDGLNQLGKTVATGLYIYQIQAGQFNQVRKILFVK